MRGSKPTGIRTAFAEGWTSMLRLRENDFLLGLFGPNCSSGVAVTKIPERWSGSWEDNLALARLADAVGIDFVLPIARWMGFGGDTNFQESVLDPTVYATAMAANSRRLTAVTTIHTAFTHPIVAAKQLATADRVSGGRVALNIVAGWNKPEFDAFGVDLPTAHDDRYALAQEWYDIVERIWASDGPVRCEGRFFQVNYPGGAPKPTGRITVLNAGSSRQGRDFAARNADFIFTIVGGPEAGKDVVPEITGAAKERFGRSAGVLTNGHVVCGPTRQEALDYLHYYADENADWPAVDKLMAELGVHAQSYKQELLQAFRSRFAAGHGSCPLIGTPDEVAAEIAKFSAAGFSGMTLSFVDYVGELEYFAQEVLPRLERMGVRKPR